MTFGSLFDNLESVEAALDLSGLNSIQAKTVYNILRRQFFLDLI